MGVEKVEVYRTSDGQLHADEAVAKEHEFGLWRGCLIARFLEHQVATDYTERGKATAARVAGDMLDMLAAEKITLPWYQGEESK